MLSRSPSPPKSPTRPALISKDSNIRQPLSKSTTPKLSPQKPITHTQRSSSTSPSRSTSPLKRTATALKPPVPQTGFVIYSDQKDYTAEIQLASTRIHEDQNDLTQHKENITPQLPQKVPSKRKALADINIHDFPGHIHYHQYAGSHSFQLSEPWTNELFNRLPSYITPPRNKHIKYIAFETEKPKKMKRSSSSGDIDTSRVIKKLVFNICKD